MSFYRSNSRYEGLSSHQDFQVVVEVRINDVRRTEIQTLSSLLQSAGRRECYDKRLVNASGMRLDFIITIKKGELEGLKSALRVALRIVAADRIDIVV